MDKKTCDFSGWATRNDIRCSDGRTIRRDCFKHNDGQVVPLVWDHNHQSPDNILGHALLENRENGVYAYCWFNDTEQAQTSKELVKHGDICSLSIYANQLKQTGGDVTHGTIREVSLVLAGANPGAKIENVMVHSDDDTETSIIKAPYQQLGNAEVEATLMHAENNEDKDMEDNKKEDNKDKTIEEVFNTLTEEQKTVVYALIGAALEENTTSQEDNKEMKQNAFEGTENNENVIKHSDIEAAIKAAQKSGSLKDEINELCLSHGITNIEALFPEVKAISNQPTTINDNTDWVNKVMNSVHHTPFSRVKMMSMDIRGDAARARGYTKGKHKEEEIIAALKRTTSPQMVYKKQKLDRDDIIDITDLDVVAYVKSEMRGKLNEEIARAILIGDGRPNTSDDKIDPLCIRPILGDDSTYVTAKYLTKGTMTDSDFAKYFIKECKRSRKMYKGKGNPTLFCTEDLLTEMLLIEDKNERVIYDTMDKLKTALRVADIVTVAPFENQTRSTETATYDLMAILVNLDDYNVGADKGGEVNMFDDFDIDYNKYTYLIETKISGAMTTPFGAITFEKETKNPTNNASNSEEPSESAGE